MKKYLLILILLIVCSARSAAQLPIEAGGGNPGAVNRQWQNQYQDLKIEQNVIQKTPEDLEEQEELRKQQQPPKDHQQGNIIHNPKFKLRNLKFKGNTIYSDKKLKSMAKDILGQEIYLEDVLNYTLKISRFYQQNGYLTTYASIEPQEITSGVVTITIHESRVGEKKVNGNFWVRKWYIKKIATGGTHLSKGKVFSAKQLQGAMKNINREPYMNTSVAIERDAEENTILEFDMKDRFPGRLSISWDDYGRDLIGRQRATITGGMENLTGFGDRAYGGVILAQNSTGTLAGYSLPVSTYGTRLSFDYAHMITRPKGALAPLDIVGNSNFYILKLTQPIINTAETDLHAYASFDWIDATTDIHSIEAHLVDYVLRVVRLGVNFLHDDLTGRWIGNLGVDLGINGLGASPDVHHGPHSGFQKFVASLARVQRLPHDCLGIVRVNGQYSIQPLFAAEQMFIGGPYSVRGYQPSELVGDWGIAGGAEYRFPIISQKLTDKISGNDKSETQWKSKFINSVRERWRLLVFYDWGYVNSHADLFDYPRHFIHSTGVGATINFMNGLSLQIGVGIPLATRVLDENNARMYFSLNTEIDRLFLKPKAHKPIKY